MCKKKPFFPPLFFFCFVEKKNLFYMQKNSKKKTFLSFFFVDLFSLVMNKKVEPRNKEKKNSSNAAKLKNKRKRFKCCFKNFGKLKQLVKNNKKKMFVYFRIYAIFFFFVCNLFIVYSPHLCGYCSHSHHRFQFAKQFFRITILILIFILKLLHTKSTKCAHNTND